MVSTPLAGDDFDMDQFTGMEPVQMMFAMRKALEYKMPPVGLTTHRARFGGYEWVRNTWRCEVPGCYYVCTPIVGDTRSVEDIIAHHRGTGDEYRCPTPPRRESLPSGLAEIEKLWREIDDVVDAIKSGDDYRGMSVDQMMGYVKGLAFTVVMKDKDFWPDIKAVSRQAGMRWKMRQGKIPYTPTPTRHENDFSSMGQQGGWRKEKPTSPPPTKTAPRKAAPVAKLDPAKELAVKAALGAGMFSIEEIAQVYGVTVAQVKQVAS